MIGQGWRGPARPQVYAKKRQEDSVWVGMFLIYPRTVSRTATNQLQESLTDTSGLVLTLPPRRSCSADKRRFVGRHRDCQVCLVRLPALGEALQRNGTVRTASGEGRWLDIPSARILPTRRSGLYCSEVLRNCNSRASPSGKINDVRWRPEARKHDASVRLGSSGARLADRR